MITFVQGFTAAAQDSNPGSRSPTPESLRSTKLYNINCVTFNYFIFNGVIFNYITFNCVTFIYVRFDCVKCIYVLFSWVIFNSIIVNYEVV